MREKSPIGTRTLIITGSALPWRESQRHAAENALTASAVIGDASAAMKMHDDETAIDAELVRRLVAGQFPRLAGLPVTPFRSTGTVNAIYRLGDSLYARLPRVARWAGDLEAEGRWLPWLAPRLPLRVPEPVATGRPGEGYPWTWAIYRWIERPALRR